MKRKQFSEEQIIGILKEAEAGAVVTDLCRLHILVRRDGIAINRKKTQRLYREEGLTMRRRKGRTSAGAWTSCMIRWLRDGGSASSTSSMM
jgi:transposase